MSNRKPVRRLAKGAPTDLDLRKILGPEDDRSDYAVAIINASIVERMLEQLLSLKMVNLNDELKRSLFGHRGPLSDFSSKILIGRAIGIYNDLFMKELNLMRDIRNAFAHAPTEVTFETKEISDAVLAGLMNSVIQNAADEQLGKGVLPIGGRMGFTLMTQLLCFLLAAILVEAGGESMIANVSNQIIDENRTGPYSRGAVPGFPDF